jgi:hypothetical protein
MTRRRPYRARPWRAVATTPDPATNTGRAEVGRVAACTEPGLDRFRAAHTAAGHAVTVWEQTSLADVQTSPSPGR